MTQARIDVRVRARGRRNELLGFRGGVLQAQVTGPPVDGKANKALCELIAKQAGVAPSSVTVVRGAKSRDKTVMVEGVGSEELEQSLR